MDKLFIITGAYGHLGNTIMRLLLQDNVSIRGLVLPSEKLPAYSQVEYVQGDVCDIESLEPLFANIDNKSVYVIHTAGLISIADKASPALENVNVQGTKNMISLCLKYHVHRFVYVSSVHAMNELSGIMHETHHYSSDSVAGPYAKTKAKASAAVLEAVNNGLAAIIVLPSGIIGPYGNTSNHLVQLVDDYIHYRLFACVKGGYDFVDVRDVAEGCILAAKIGKIGESYILSHQYYSIKSLLKMCKRIAGGPPILTFPLFIAKMFSSLIGFIAKTQNKRPLYTQYSLSTISSKSRFSHEKATQELGYTTRSIETTLADTISWLTKGKPH